MSPGSVVSPDADAGNIRYLDADAGADKKLGRGGKAENAKAAQVQFQLARRTTYACPLVDGAWTWWWRRWDGGCAERTRW